MRGSVAPRRANRSSGRSTTWGELPLSIWPSACLLASSWTWAIATLYPVLLARDFGVSGWLVFVVPNIVGAAAVGLLSSTQTRWIQLHHRRALRAFSFVTIGFHAFALLWLGLLYGQPVVLVMMAIAGLVGLLALSSLRSWSVAAAALTVFGIALITITVAMAVHPELGWLKPLRSLAPPRLPGTLPLVALGIANGIGFLCCPFLDPSLLGVRSRLGSDQARRAFLLGFGLFFLLHLVFALLYAQRLAPLFLLPGATNTTLDVEILLFIVLQSIFTLGLHVAFALRTSPSRPRTLVATGAAILLGLLLALFAATPGELLGKSTGEIVYRGFLVIYGAVFPAYVLLRLFPKALRWRVALSSSAERTLVSAVVLLALPGALLYFLADQSLLLGAAAAPLLAGFLLVASRRRRPKLF